MKKYVVYFENYDGTDEIEIFDKKEDADKYIEKQEENIQFSPEESMYWIEEERR